SAAPTTPPPTATLLSTDSLNPTPAQLVTPAGTPGVQPVGWNSTEPTLDFMLERLQQRGATRLRLDLVDGQWLFSCDIPNPASPNVKKHFENADASRQGAVRPIFDEVERLARRP
ncbi:MAG TPA: hypothetical protein PKD86_16590, partial [Gemmatales bacterium]|nr:hypothetical protein [Gemmatales bacterium]